MTTTTIDILMIRLNNFLTEALQNTFKVSSDDKIGYIVDNVKQIILQTLSISIIPNESDQNDQIVKLENENVILKHGYRDMENKAISATLEATTSIQKIADLNFKIKSQEEKLKFLNDQLVKLHKEYNRVQNDNMELNNKLISRHIVKAEDVNDETIEQFDDCDFVYYVELLNQFVTESSYIIKTDDISIAFNKGIEIIKDNTYNESVYITTMYNNKVLSRYNVNEGISRMTESLIKQRNATVSDKITYLVRDLLVLNKMIFIRILKQNGGLEN